VRTKGQLLVAEPQLGDPNFDRTVVLMVEHNAEGALGIVLNRPTDVTVVDAIPAWADLASPPGLIHIGGPVEEQTGWCLAQLTPGEDQDGFAPVLGTLGMVDLEIDPTLLAPRAVALRLYAGYSGWGPGQLDWELQQGAWIVVDADESDPFLAGDTLWEQILLRQGGKTARLANFPRDPSWN